MKAWESYGLSSVKRMSLRARRNPSKFGRPKIVL
jgi:hypothetical protein